MTIAVIVALAAFALSLFWVIRRAWGMLHDNEEMVPGGSQGRQMRRVKDERPEEY